MLKDRKDIQYYKFCFYGFFKNLRLFDPFLLLYFVDIGLSYSEIGFLYAFREVVINLLEILSGVIADVLGRKKAMMVAFVSYIVSFILFYGLTSFAGFLLAFLFYGLGDSFRTGTHKAMINAYLIRKGWEDEKVQYYGRTRSWSQGGAAICSLLSAGLLLYTGDYSLLFLLTALPYVFDLLLLSSYPSYLNGESNLRLSDLWPHVLRHVKDLALTVKRFSSAKVLVLTSGFTGYYKAAKDYVQIIVTALASRFVLEGLNQEQQIAVYVGLTYFGLYVLTSVASRHAYLVQRIGLSARSSLVFLQVIGYGLGCLAAVFFLLDFYLLALLLFASIFIIQNLRRPLAVNYITTQFDEKMMASIMPVESQGETLFAALFALLLGIIVDMAGLGWGIGVLSVLLLGLSVLVGKLKVKE